MQRLVDELPTQKETLEFISVASTDERKALVDRVRCTCDAIAQIREQMEEELPKLHKEILGSNIEVQLRAEAMIATLIKVRELSITKAIFVAGISHLMAIDDGRTFDLPSLYAELAHHKAAILIPKFIFIGSSFQV